MRIAKTFPTTVTRKYISHSFRRLVYYAARGERGLTSVFQNSNRSNHHEEHPRYSRVFSYVFHDFLNRKPIHFTMSATHLSKSVASVSLCFIFTGADHDFPTISLTEVRNARDKPGSPVWVTFEGLFIR